MLHENIDFRLEDELERWNPDLLYDIDVYWYPDGDELTCSQYAYWEDVVSWGGRLLPEILGLNQDKLIC